MSTKSSARTRSKSSSHWLRRGPGLKLTTAAECRRMPVSRRCYADTPPTRLDGGFVNPEERYMELALSLVYECHVFEVDGILM